MKGSFRQNKSSGTWYARIDLERDASGKRRQVHLNAKTRRALETKVALCIAEAENHGFPEGRHTTVRDVAHKWLETKRHLQILTVDSYEATVAKYIIPSLGNQYVGNLSSADVQRAIDQWVSEPRFDKKKGRRSNTTVRYAITVLSMIMKWARAMKLTNRDPLLDVVRPRRTKPPKVGVGPHQAAVVVDATRDTLLYVATLTSFVCGLRRGETIGLAYSDLDEASKKLIIRRSVVCRKRSVYIKEPKTNAGIREIDLDDQTLNWLVMQRNERRDFLRSIGVSADTNTPLFDRGDGERWHPDAFGSAYRRIVKAAGIPHLKLNGTRHSFASIAVNAGVHLDVISEVMGHDSRFTTAEWYVNVNEATRRAALGTVSGAILAELRRIRAERDTPQGTALVRSVVEAS